MKPNHQGKVWPILWPFSSPSHSETLLSLPSLSDASVLHRSASWLPMMLMLMSSHPSQHPWHGCTAIFPLLFRLIDGQEHPSLLLSPTLAPGWRTAAQPEPSLSLSLSGGLSMYGCAKERDAVGWQKTKKHSPLRTFTKGILALSWMGRGFNLCGRRVWAAEVRNAANGCHASARCVRLIFRRLVHK